MVMVERQGQFHNLGGDNLPPMNSHPEGPMLSTE